MKKKLMVCTLAMAAVLGTSFPAFAAGNVDSIESAVGGTEVTGSSSVQTPVIDITVPTSLDIVINPFGLEFAPDAQQADTKVSDVIYSATQEVVNNSNVDVVMNVEELKAVPSDGITLATTAITSKVTTKSLYLSLDVSYTPDGAGEATTTQVAIPGIAASDTKTKAVSKTGLATLKANDTTTTDDDTKATFKVTGSAVANPTKTNADKTVTADPWTASDTVDLSMKFTFTPQVKSE